MNPHISFSKGDVKRLNERRLVKIEGEGDEGKGAWGGDGRWWGEKGRGWARVTRRVGWVG